MSTTIDERVVQMRFDNKQFEAGAQQSMQTLDQFKQKLDFTGIADKANSELNNVGSVTETVGIRFDAMAVVAISALNRITNAAITAGSNILKSLTIAPVSDGFAEYELKMGSVQTIMASTGATLEEVNGYLDELNTYADKTIYSFSDMTASIGKFTNAGVDLDKAVKAIQGISNEAALSGANANEASRAMYNFAQALSSGSVRLIDWKSIENANMATVEFKNELIKTAVELGTVVQQGDKFVSTTTDLNGHVSDAFDSVSMFNDSLSAQWMTTDVLIETLSRYADETTDLGQRAFAAAQDVKTFSQLMDTLKEAVGSGWAQTFEIIFGNFEEAKELWTGVSNVIGGFIDRQSDARNELLQGWKDLGGRTALIDTIAAAFRNVSDVVSGLAEGFKRIFPPVTSQQLYNATIAVKALVEQLKLSEGAIFTLREAFKALLLPIQVFVQVARIAIAVLMNLIPIIWNLIDSVLSLPANLQRVEAALRKVFGDERYNRLAAAMSTIVSKLAQGFRMLFGAIGQVIGGFRNLSASRLGEAFGRLLEVLRPIGEWMLDRIVQGIEAIANADYSKLVEWAEIGLSMVIDKLANILEFTSGVTKAIVGFFAQFLTMTPLEFFQAITNGIVNLGKNFSKFVQEVLKGDIFQRISEFVMNLARAIQSFVTQLTPAKILVAGFGTAMTAMFFNISAAFSAFAKVGQSIVGLVENIGGVFGALKDRLKKNKLLAIATAILVLAGALAVLAMVDSARLVTATKAMLAVMAGLTIMVAAMAAIDKFLLDGGKMAKSLQQVGIAMVAMAGSVLILAGAMTMLASIGNPTNLIIPLIMVVGTMVALAATMKLLAKSDEEFQANSLALVAMALSVKIVVGVLQELTGIPLGNMITGLLSLIVVMGTLGLVGKAIGKVKITNALGLTVMILDLLLVVKVLKKLSDLDPETMIRGVIGMLGVIVAMIPLMAFTKLAADDAVKMGVSIVAISAAMILLSVAIKQLSAFDMGQIIKAGIVIAGLMSMFAILTIASYFAGANAGKIGQTFVAMSVAILILGLAIDYIGNLKLKTVLQGTVVVTALMAMFVLVELASSYAEKGTKSIIAMGVVIGLLMASIALLTLIPFVEAMKSVVVLGSLLLAFGATMKLSEKANFSVKTIVFMIAFLAEVALVVAALNAIKLKDGMIEKVASLTLIMVALALSSSKIKARTGSTSNLVKTLAFIGLFAAEASLIVATLAMMPSTNGLLAKTASLVAVMAAMTTFGDKLKARTGDPKNLTKTLAFVGMFAAEAALVVAALNMIPIEEGLLAKTASLSAVMGMMTLMGMTLQPMSKGTDWGQIIQTIVMMGSMLAMAGVTILAINAIPINDGLFEKTAALSLLMGVMTGVIAAISAVSSGLIALAAGGIGMAVSAIAVIDLFIADIVGMVLLIGGLFALFPQLEGPLAKAEEVIPRIGSVLGGFVGSVVGSFAEAAAAGLGSSLVTIADSFSAFGEAIKPFLDSMASVKKESVDGAMRMTEMILALTGASFLNGLTNFMPFVSSSTLEDIGIQLEKLGPHFRAFAMEMDGIPVEEVEAAGTCLSSLANLLVALPVDGGLWGEIFGEKDFSSFGTSLESFAEAFGKYCAVIKDSGITKKVVDVTAYACDALAKFAKSIPSSGGLLQDFFGSKDIDQFGLDLESFAKSLVKFYDTLKAGKIDYGVVESATIAAQGLADFASSIPREGGWLQTALGKQDVGTFGEEIKKFAEGLAGFFAVFAGENGAVIDQKTVDMAVKAGAAFTEFAKTIPNSGGAFEFFTGSNDMSDFSMQIALFGMGLAAFFSKFREAGVTQKEADVASTSINALAGIVSAFADMDSTDDFALSLTKIAAAVLNYYKAVQSIEFSQFNAATKAIGELSDVLTSLSMAGEGIADGIRDIFTQLVEIAEEVLDADASGESQKFYTLGQGIISGTRNGIAKDRDELLSDIETLGNDLLSKFKKAVGVNSPSTKFKEIAEYLLAGLNIGLQNGRPALMQNMASIGTAMIDKLKEILGIHSPSTVARDEVGRFIIRGIAEGITSDMSAEEAASKKAQNIIDAFKSEFEKFSLDMTTFGLEFDLWSAKADSATMQEIREKNVELLTNKLKAQAERVDLANAQYKATLEALGEQAKETQEAYNTYIQEQIDMVSLANDLISARKELLTAGSFDIDTSQLEYTLWEKMHNTAGEQEKAFKQVDLINKQLANHAQVVAYANARYQSLLETLGEQASATRTAYQEYLQAQIDMADVAGQFIDMRDKYFSDITVRTLDQWMAEMYEPLHNMGFSDDEIMEVGRKETGAYAGSLRASTAETVEGVMNDFLDRLGDVIVDISASAGQTANDVVAQVMSQTTSALSSVGEVDVVIEQVVQRAATGGSTAGDVMTGSMATSVSNGMPSVDNAVQTGLEQIIQNGVNTASAGGQQISNTLIDRASDWITNVGDYGMQWVNDTIGGYQASGAKDAGYEMGNATTDGMTDAWSDNTSMVNNAAAALMETASVTASTTGYNGMYNAGVNAAAGFMNGMNSAMGGISATASNVAMMSVNSTNRTLGIHSPSRVFYQIGKYIDQGLANGITDEFSIVNASLRSATKKVASAGNDLSLAMRPVFNDVDPWQQQVEDYYDSILEWDSEGNLLPRGRLAYQQSGKWLKVDKAIADAVRTGETLLAQAAYDAALEFGPENFPNVSRHYVGLPNAEAYAGTGGYQFIFNQTNNSPKALSTSEIYRQTKTEFRKTVDKMTTVMADPTTGKWR